MMRSSFFCLLLLVAFLAVVARGEDTAAVVAVENALPPVHTCQHVFSDGRKYDLSALAKQYTATNPVSVNSIDGTFLWSPCATIAASSCPNVQGNPTVCQISSTGGSNHNAGANPAVWTEASPNSVLLTFNNGDAGRLTKVTIVCDKKAGEGVLKVDGPNDDPEHPQLTYNFIWTSASAWACPQSGGGGGGGGGDDGLSGGWIFIIVLFVTFVLYIVIGVLWQKFKVHAEGIELIPNVHFWISLPGLVKDGHLFIYRKITGGGQTYQTV